MKNILAVVGVAVVVGILAYWLGGRQAAAPEHAHPEQTLPAIAPTAQAYVCPMHPHIVQDHPGDCPICGMDLVIMKDAAGAAAHQIHVDTATQQKLGVRLEQAAFATLTHDISVYGTLVADESAVLRITPNVSGLLTRLHVSRVGQRIERGQLLYELSSKEALDIQYEYIDTLRRGLPAMNMAVGRREQNRVKLEKARALGPAEIKQAEHEISESEEQLRSILQPLDRDLKRSTLRLKQIGFSEAMLDRLSKSKEAFEVIRAHAPRACVVQAVMARPGMSVEAMTEILQCVDPAAAQIELVLYPDQLDWVEEGDAVTLAFADGETVKARLPGLPPLVDEVTRTLRVRLPVTLERTPRLGEYAQATIHTTEREVLSVPKSAVMRTGRGDFVMRALDKGHFMPVKVVTGIESAERVAILEGLQEGDTVAVNGQFLLDAAASMADVGQRLKSPASQDGK